MLTTKCLEFHMKSLQLNDIFDHVSKLHTTILQDISPILRSIQNLHHNISQISLLSEFLCLQQKRMSVQQGVPVQRCFKSFKNIPTSSNVASRKDETQFLIILFGRNCRQTIQEQWLLASIQATLRAQHFQLKMDSWRLTGAPYFSLQVAFNN